MSENVRFRLNRVREIRICNRIKKLPCNLCAIAIKNIREKLTRKSNKECRFLHLAEQVKCIIISLSSSIQFVKVLRKSSAHSIIIYPEPIRAITKITGPSFLRGRGGGVDSLFSPVGPQCIVTRPLIARHVLFKILGAKLLK